MEFDVESFMFDAKHSTPALDAVGPSRWLGGLGEVDETINYGDIMVEEPSEEYDEFLQYLQYPSEESGNAPPPTRSTRHDPQCVEPLPPSEQNNDFEPAHEFSGSLTGLFHPDLDMTTALMGPFPAPHLYHSLGFASPEKHPSMEVGFKLGECQDVVSSFYTFTIKACLLPIRKVQHELVTLYFQHIHPMFPVVDEYYFTELHRKYRGHEQFMDPSDFLIYQAITAAGFGHLSEVQLQRTPFRSVHEGQEAQFDQVKARYWSLPTGDPVVLTQICLIISLWSPGPAGVQNNSYYINLAFKHANAGQLWKPKPPVDGRPCRRRLLWWCCLVRDRILALGMRRPSRLHRGPSEEDLISQRDFGFDPSLNPTSDMRSERIAIMAFTWLCKLSEIMAAIAIFQQRSKFSREWNGENVGRSTSELEEVVAFDRDIRTWKDAFEADAFKVIGGQSLHDSQDVPIPLSILRIVCNSLVAFLYQPYLHLSCLDHPPLAEEAIDPLQRMKEGSQGVESIVVGLISNKKSDTLPNWLVSWVTLPVAVYYVNQHVKLNPAPDKVLMPFLNRFMRRTTGAQFLFLTLTRAIKEFFQRLDESNQATKAKVFRLRNIASSADMLGHTNSLLNAGNKIVEASLLAFVTKSLDSTLEFAC